MPDISSFTASLLGGGISSVTTPPFSGSSVLNSNVQTVNETIGSISTIDPTKFALSASSKAQEQGGLAASSLKGISNKVVSDGIKKLDDEAQQFKDGLITGDQGIDRRLTVGYGSYSYVQVVANQLDLPQKPVGIQALMNPYALFRVSRIGDDKSVGTVKSEKLFLDLVGSDSIRLPDPSAKRSASINFSTFNNLQKLSQNKIDPDVEYTDNNGQAYKPLNATDLISISNIPTISQTLGINLTQILDKFSTMKDISSSEQLMYDTLKSNMNGTSIISPEDPKYFLIQKANEYFLKNFNPKNEPEPNQNQFKLIRIDNVNKGSDYVNAAKKKSDESKNFTKKKVEKIRPDEPINSNATTKITEDKKPSENAGLTKKLPFVSNLVEDFTTSSDKNNTNFYYTWNDFLYCKHFGHIPNNRLITIRRFPAPVLDNGQIMYQDNTGDRGQVYPIAQAVTWFGTGTGNNLSDITSISGGIKWKDYTDGNGGKPNYIDNNGATGGKPAPWSIGFGLDSKNDTVDRTVTALRQAVKSTSSIIGESSIVNTVFDKIQAFTTSPYFKDFIKLMAVAQATKNKESTGDMKKVSSALSEYLATNNPYANNTTGLFANRIDGPINTISSVLGRDRGIEAFKKEIKVQFQYSLKSIGGINPKVAMLDILANLLSISYINGEFWGGENRYFTDRVTFQVKNLLPIIEKLAGKEYKTGFENLIKLAQDELPKLGEHGTKIFNKLLEGMKKISSDEKGDFNLTSLLANFGKGVKEAKKTIANSADTALTFAGESFGGNFSREGGYYDTLIKGVKPVLTGEPTGEWHLMVGNPYNPIMVVGNLACVGFNFKFNEELGYDDFPTELTFEIQLKNCMARDRGGVESVFNYGQGPLYWGKGPSGLSAAEVTSATQQSVGLGSTGKVPIVKGGDTGSGSGFNHNTADDVDIQLFPGESLNSPNASGQVNSKTSFGLKNYMGSSINPSGVKAAQNKGYEDAK